MKTTPVKPEIPAAIYLNWTYCQDEEQKLILYDMMLLKTETEFKF